jgi:hypothetical protein
MVCAYEFPPKTTQVAENHGSGEENSCPSFDSSHFQLWLTTSLKKRRVIGFKNVQQFGEFGPLVRYGMVAGEMRPLIVRLVLDRTRFQPIVVACGFD